MPLFDFSPSKILQNHTIQKKSFLSLFKKNNDSKKVVSERVRNDWHWICINIPNMKGKEVFIEVVN